MMIKHDYQRELNRFDRHSEYDVYWGIAIGVVWTLVLMLGWWAL